MTNTIENIFENGLVNNADIHQNVVFALNPSYSYVFSFEIHVILVFKHCNTFL